MFARSLALLLFLVVVVALVARPSGGAGHEQVYVVEPYDTLWSIASAHYAGDPRESIPRIESRNHLRDAMIQPGERLLLPP